MFFSFSLTASTYDIRFSTNLKQLRSSFGEASQLNDSNIIVGNLSSPSAAAEKETFVVRFPAAYIDVTLFFGLMVNHSGGRISDVSNIVTAAIVYVPPINPPTTSEPDYTTEGATTREDTTTMDQTTKPDTMVQPTTPTKPTTTTTEIPTTTAQLPDVKHNSAEAQLVVKLAVGSAMPIIVIIIVAIVIKLKYSRRSRRNNSQEEDGMGGHYLPPGNAPQCRRFSPYSHPVGPMSVVGHQHVENVRPIYLPDMNPYQVHGYGGQMPNRPPQYGYPPNYGHQFGWVASR